MSKKTLTLGIVLIILIALAFIYQWPLKKWQNNLGKPRNFLAQIDAAKIDKIEVISGGNTVVLTKQGNASATSAGSVQVKWRFNNSKDFYADPAIMSSVLGSLEEAKASELDLISNNQTRKGEFKTDSAGLTVKIYQADKKAADFIIGGQTGDYNGSYISTAASPDTYSVQADLRAALEQSEWRDLTIFSTDKDKIKKIRFQYPNREFTVELTADKWSGILPEKFTVNEEKVDKIVEIMASLKAVEIPEQTFENTGLDKHLIIIEAAGDGVDNVLMVGGGNKGELYYAKRGDSDNIYLIDKSDRDELDKWIGQLR